MTPCITIDVITYTTSPRSRKQCGVTFRSLRYPTHLSRVWQPASLPFLILLFLRHCMVFPGANDSWFLCTRRVLFYFITKSGVHQFPQLFTRRHTLPLDSLTHRGWLESSGLAAAHGALVGLLHRHHNSLFLSTQQQTKTAGGPCSALFFSFLMWLVRAGVGGEGNENPEIE